MAQARCCRCNRPLTDPFSIAIGMGPECRGRLSKHGWRFPKPRYRIRHGHVELVGMVGKIVEPPPVGDLTDKKRKVKREASNQSD
ncbi:MAG: hypothetical protein EHM40_03340 [Chloroflexi bacterium]|nr:MAG: hypothetical protein EHM40_03340 [Chloroflexota bacterium]